MNDNSTIIRNDDISIVLCGQAGQGIKTIEHLLTRVLKLSGFNVFASREYMSRIRGGSNSTEIRVSSKRVTAYTDKIDILIPINPDALKHLKNRISKETVVLGEKEQIEDIDEDYRLIDIPVSKISTRLGSKIYSNMVAAGVISGIFNLESKIVSKYIEDFFVSKGKDVIKRNLEAIKLGYKLGKDILKSGKLKIEISNNRQIIKEILLNGAEAIALGAIAGGCNFVSFYPMSPSTGIVTQIAQHSKEFDIIVEQAEDEISAINMAIGAWYAGARAFVVTSGGGFDLMAEGISLSGILETPVVIHIGQRPGPATGLPTRTEQGDIEIALYSGHGEFPRAIFTPGSIEDAFYLTQKAFNIADKYQIPAIILTDQYLIDLYYNIPSLDLSRIKIDSFVIETKREYNRYGITENGITPRGIPGFGKGLVCVDSDEHDEAGHITENFEIRTKMVQKRLRKLKSLEKDIISPEFFGKMGYKKLVIGWGSTYNVLKEAIERLGQDFALLHFKQIYPLCPDIEKYINNAEKTVIFENNATSQFSKLIKIHTGLEMDKKVLKYNGLPFSIEEVMEHLKSL